MSCSWGHVCPWLAQLRFAAPLATAQARSARPLGAPSVGAFAQCLGGLEQETRRQKRRLQGDLVGDGAEGWVGDLA